MTGTPILVVDDAPVNRKLMRLLLTHEGYDVRTVERAEDALQMLPEYRPELILADIQLPGMNGLEMTRKLKEDPRTSAIRVVALTARQEDRDKALRAGCEDYISKPIDTATLSSRLRELLARPAAGHAEPVKEIASASSASMGSSLSFSGPEMEVLRRHFLNEGITTCRQLLESLNGPFDPVLAAGQLHTWIGSAGLLGFPEITSLARNGEELLSENPVQMPRLRGVLSDLLYSFSDLLAAKSQPLPESVIQATAGKRIALIGFSPERADTMCALLEQAKARPFLFDASDDPQSAAIRDCDLVIFHVRQETLESAWLRADAPLAAGIKLALTGRQGDLIGLKPQVRARALDFLVDSGAPEEVLMRLAFAISRGVAEPVSAPPREVAPRPAVACPTVVLADDDAIVLTLVRSTIQNYGMSCRSFDNGFDALELIRRDQPHAAVLDVNMPGMDGFEVLAAIRAEKLSTRVILLTSLQREKEILRAFQLGADDYLTKPFNPFELVARLKRLLQ